MIPILAMISWKRNQRIPLCIPILFLWPIAGVVFCVAWIVGAVVPKLKTHTERICMGIAAFAKMRGLHVEIESDDTTFRLRII
ncbi:MAG: hypothetical protein OXG24_07980 [Gammaproteobacteria bacterium]|nr:hypothetical protein [Gammaproteobacteria bacterium]MCY4143346.1 hypothetical protein [Gammaproteobacteria bacterium]